MGAAVLDRLVSLTLAGTLVAACILLMEPIAKRYFSAGWRRSIWLCALMAFVIPFTLPVPVFPVFHGAAPTLGTPTIKETWSLLWAELPSVKSIQMAAPQRLPVATAALTVWLSGMVVFLGWKLLNYLHFSKSLKRCAIKVTDQTPLRLLECCKQELGIHANIRLMSCPQIASPMLTGILQPVIYLPELPITMPELRLALLHELNHHRSGDLLYKLAALLVNAVHWVNPMAYVVCARIDTACEYACDEAVVRSMDQQQRKSYAAAILNMLDASQMVHGQLYTLFAQRSNHLKRRLQLIMEYRKPKRRTVIAGICAAVLLASAGVYASSSINYERLQVRGAPAQKQPSSAPQGDSALSAQQEEPVASSAQADDPLESLKLGCPVPGGEIICRFEEYEGHTGVDYKAEEGTKVVAANSGRVTLAEAGATPYGKYVIIDHGAQVSTLYAHCSELLVTEGESVDKGQVIARSGKTGRVTGPFLRFELRMNGEPMDPEPYLP